MLAQNDLRKLKRHWDNKLSASTHNPWPLAPHDLVRIGKVHHDNYLHENGKFTGFCTSHMLSELDSIYQSTKSKPVRPRRIEVLGPGLGNRDLRWLGTAIEDSFNFNVRDISTIAMKNIHLLFQQFIDEGRIKIIIGEIEQTMRKIKVDPHETIAYFGSQFFQVLNRKKMRNTLAKLGSILSQWPKDVVPKPRVYIVHPLPEDNEGPKVWNGIDLPGVEWGDTIPYSLDELLEAFECELCGRKGIADVRGKASYYHQRYSFIRFSLEA